MKNIVCLLLSMLIASPAFGQTLARTYTQESDRSATPSLFSFYNPVDKKTYVLNGDPANFALPVSGAFTVVPAPVKFTRNGVLTDTTLDTVTPANNRPLPFTLLAGDSLGPVAVGSGNTSASVLRFRLVDDQTLPISATSLPLPTGASTAANQTTANASLSSIDGKLPAQVSGRVPVDGSGVTQPVSAASLPLPTGAATAANQATEISALSMLISQTDGIESSLSSLDTKTPALGQASSAGSSPVVLPAAQITALTPQTNALTDAQLRASPVPTDTTTINGSTVLTGYGNGSLGGAQRFAAMLGLGTSAVSAANAVPTYATDGASNTVSFGSGAAASNTQRVVLANESSPQYGRTAVQLVSATQFPFFQDTAATPITTSYTQIVASTPADINFLRIHNQTSQPLALATGAAASEVIRYIALPGTDVDVPIRIASGTRLAIKSLNAATDSQYVAINAFL